MLDRLGIGVRECERLCHAFHLRTTFLEVVVELLTHRMERLVIVQRSVLDLGVLFPCVGGRTTDDDLEAVVVDSAGEIGRQEGAF